MCHALSMSPQTTNKEIQKVWHISKRDKMKTHSKEKKKERKNNRTFIIRTVPRSKNAHFPAKKILSFVIRVSKQTPTIQSPFYHFFLRVKHSRLNFHHERERERGKILREQWLLFTHSNKWLHGINRRSWETTCTHKRKERKKERRKSKRWRHVNSLVNIITRHHHTNSFQLNEQRGTHTHTHTQTQRDTCFSFGAVMSLLVAFTTAFSMSFPSAVTRRTLSLSQFIAKQAAHTKKK